MSLFDSASLCITPNAYKEDKLYSIKPTDGSGDLVVTRATTATRVNSAGLIEQVPYNLVTYSNDFTNAAWSKNNATVTANSIISPDGTQNASLISSTSTTESGIFQIIDVSGTNTWSFYAKKGTGRYVFLNTNVPLIAAKFDLESGVVVGTPSLGATASIENVGNGWYRCILSSSTSVNRFTIFITNNTTTTDVTSSVGLNFYLYGAQLVTGSSAKEYFPTTDRLNVPRIDYTNGSCPSILVEPQRTNLVFPSNIILSGNGTLAQNVAISPDGTNNANSFTPSGAGFIYTNSILTTLQTYTFSIYLKGTVNGQKVRIQADLNGDLIDFTLTNQWQKYSVTFNSLLGMQSFYILSGNYFSPAQNNLYYFYGAQLEAGSYATSLIPTQSTSVTRNADVISKTGISSLIGQTEGTMFVDIDFNGTGYGTTNDFFVYVGDGANTDAIYIDYFNNTFRWVVFNGSTLAFYTDIATTNGRKKLALGYKSGQYVAYLNGNLVLADTNATAPPTSANFSIAQNVSGFSNITKNINASALWKTRLTNAELATLTTI
jgi:hypothetical protein